MAKRILSKTSWKDAIGASKKPKRLKLLSHISHNTFAPYRIVKVNLIKVNVVVVNMFSQSMVGITTLKKSQTLPKFFLNFVHVQTTINFLSE